MSCLTLSGFSFDPAASIQSARRVAASWLETLMPGGPWSQQSATFLDCDKHHRYLNQEENANVVSQTFKTLDAEAASQFTARAEKTCAENCCCLYNYSSRSKSANRHSRKSLRPSRFSAEATEARLSKY